MTEEPGDILKASELSPAARRYHDDIGSAETKLKQTMYDLRARMTLEQRQAFISDTRKGFATIEDKVQSDQVLTQAERDTLLARCKRAVDEIERM
ncbi:hypothetical protein HY968_02475 [Candidatus Kaiserbacteria bacterium]|nr:hypothetical protein [Candidatus Kaiserbacteria bacterium]